MNPTAQAARTIVWAPKGSESGMPDRFRSVVASNGLVAFNRDAAETYARRGFDVRSATLTAQEAEWANTEGAFADEKGQRLVARPGMAWWALGCRRELSEDGTVCGPDEGPLSGRVRDLGTTPAADVRPDLLAPALEHVRAGDIVKVRILTSATTLEGPGVGLVDLREWTPEQLRQALSALRLRLGLAERVATLEKLYEQTPLPIDARARTVIQESRALLAQTAQPAKILALAQAKVQQGLGGEKKRRPRRARPAMARFGALQVGVVPFVAGTLLAGVMVLSMAWTTLSYLDLEARKECARAVSRFQAEAGAWTKAQRDHGLRVLDQGACGRPNMPGEGLSWIATAVIAGAALYGLTLVAPVVKASSEHAAGRIREIR